MSKLISKLFIGDDNKVKGSFSIEDAQITYRNLTGDEKQYNPQGDRNFNIILDQGQAEGLREFGFNVRAQESKNDPEDVRYLLKVKASYKFRAPKIVQITSGGKNNLDESNVGFLDWADIMHVDLICTPSSWSTSSGSGTTAYVKSMFVTLLEDEFDQKYADVPSNDNQVDGY